MVSGVVCVHVCVGVGVFVGVGGCGWVVGGWVSVGGCVCILLSSSFNYPGAVSYIVSNELPILA